MDSAPVLELLILARAFVEAGWSRNRMAKNANSTRSLSERDPAAVRFCALGAINRAEYEFGEAYCRSERRVALMVLRQVLCEEAPESLGGDLTLFNDHPYRGKAEVLALFDAACERVGKG